MSARACGFDPHSSEGVHSVNGLAQQIVDLLVWVRVPVNTYASLAQLVEREFKYKEYIRVIIVIQAGNLLM